jgi:peptidase M48-like protein
MHGSVFLSYGTARLRGLARLALLVAAGLSLSGPRADGRDHRAKLGGETAALRRVQEALDAIKTKLALPHEVTIAIVEDHPLMVAVEPVRGRQGAFVVSVEAGFLDELTDLELDAVIAHELGHVWIFTHHPFLQTEQLANDIAMQVVSRQTIESVYAKVWARGGHRSDLPRFLRDDPSPRRQPPAPAPTATF